MSNDSKQGLPRYRRSRIRMRARKWRLGRSRANPIAVVVGVVLIAVIAADFGLLISAFFKHELMSLFAIYTATFSLILTFVGISVFVYGQRSRKQLEKRSKHREWELKLTHMLEVLKALTPGHPEFLVEYELIKILLEKQQADSKEQNDQNARQNLVQNTAFFMLGIAIPTALPGLFRLLHIPLS